MSIQTVNLGTYANDGTGDDLRTAFEKVINNFDYLDLTKVEDGENLGTAIPNTYGIYAGVDGSTLQFKSIKQGDNITITSDGNTITLRPVDSINALEEDANPKLGGDLNTGGFDITSDGLPLSIYVKDNYLNLYNYDTLTGDYLPLTINALTVLGNNFNAPGTTTIGTYPGDGLSIIVDQNFTLESTNGIIVVVGAIESNSSITATEFIGNVTGQVSNIANHNLKDLGDVSDSLPQLNYALLWDGTQWAPTEVQIAGSGLTDLADVTITNPVTNEVLKYNGTEWVNAESPAGVPNISDFDLGVLGQNITNPLQLLFQALNVDFETFDNPAGYFIDLGQLEGSGITEWSSGDVDGGTPTTSIFDFYIDGGSPTTVSFTAIADGGSELGASLDGGSPGGSPSVFVDGGSPSSTPSEYIDGGTPA